MSEELNKKSGKALVWSSVTEIMAKLITPIVNIILARLLTPEAFGAVATITMVITFAEVFTDAGFQKYIVQHEFSSEDELNRGTNVAFWTNFAFSSVVVALIVIFRHKIAEIVGGSGLGDGIAVSSVVIILVAFSSIQMARFKRAFDFKTLFFVRIGASVIPLVVTVPLAFLLKNYWALIIGTVAVNAFNAVTLTVKSNWKPKFFYDFRLFKQMFSFTSWTLLESVLIWLTVNVDIFIVGSALNDYYLGIYKTSMSTVNAYMAMIASAITPVLFSTLSRYQNDDVSFKNTYWKFFKYTSIIAIPMSVGIFVYRDLVTGILLGAQWQEATNFIGLWGLMTGASMIFCNLSSEVYRSKGNPKLSMLSQLFQILCLIPTVIFALRYNFKTLYIIRAFARVYGVLINVALMTFVCKFSLLKLIKNVFPALFSSIVMFVVGSLWLSYSSNLLWKIGGVLVCIFVYFLVLFIAFPKTRKEVFTSPSVKKVLSKFKLRK